MNNLSKIKYLLVLMFVFFNLNFAFSQNTSYSSLYTNLDFQKTIDTDLPVGSIAGQGGTTSGTATYSIPISLPQGTNGVTPNISINYASQVNNGALGMGWSIGGLSSISRVNKNMHFDDKVAPIINDNSDALALDGTRLILKSGTQGTVGSKYGTESENFATISKESGSSYDYFKVITKEGVTMEFGNTFDSRYGASFWSPSPITWLLNRISYPDGNYIDFKYKTGGFTNDGIIDEINYTGNTNTGLLPYNKIKFNYKERFDKSTMYVGGIGFESKYLLDNIVITVDNNQSFKSYYFKYAKDDIHSYLKEVIEKGSDGTALNSTIFKYGEQPSSQFEASPIGPTLGQSIRVLSGDFDADGYSDMLVSNTGFYGNIEYDKSFSIYKKTSPFLPYFNASLTNVPLSPSSLPDYQMIGNQKVPYQYPYLIGDFTGDGKDNVVVVKTGYVQGKLLVYDKRTYSFSNGATSYNYTSSSLANSTYQVITSEENYIHTGDFDGDGKMDILTYLGNTGFNALDPDTNKRKLNCSCSGTITGSGVLFSIEDFDTVERIHPLDFDGDGKHELLVSKGHHLEILSIENGQLVSLYNNQYGFVNWGYKLFYGDFNGDGKTDILMREGGHTSSSWVKIISTGKSLIKIPFTFQTQAPNLSGSSPDKLIISDFNGDGKMDVFHGWNVYSGGTASSSKMNIYYSKGNDFYRRTHNYGDILNSMPNRVFDTNGDGRSELLNRESFWGSFDALSFNKDGKEHFLEKVINGEGHISEWNYQRMNNAPNGLFYKKTLTNDPLVIQLPINLVKEYKSQNGIGGYTTIQYKYEDCKLHRQGKGLLGFRKTESLKLFSELGFSESIRTISENKFNTTYHFSYPYKTETYIGLSTTPVKETKHSYNYSNLGNKRYWLKLLSTTSEDFLADWKTTTIFSQYDAYGNVKKLDSNISSDGSIINSKSVITTYGAYGSPIPSKPTSITTTSARVGQPSYSTTKKFYYNSKGQLTKNIDFYGLPKSVTTDYGYNSLGNQTSITIKPSGLSNRTESTTYDSKGRFSITTTNTLGQTTTPTIYDYRWGKPLSITGLDGLTTSFEYDAFGRLKKTSLPEGYDVHESYHWDINNTEKTVWYNKIQHPGKPDTKIWYDLLSREVKKQTEGFQNQWITEKKTYDNRGNVHTASAPHKSNENPLITTNTYDKYNRPITMVNSIGTTTYDYAYSGSGSNRYLTTTITTPSGQVSSKKIDASGVTKSATDNGGTLNYKYDAQDNLTIVEKGSIRLVENRYDSYGRQKMLIDRNAGITHYVYNALGQLESQTGANGDTHTYTYDLLDRKLTSTGPEGTITNEYYTSNGTSINQLKKTTNFNGDKEEFTYDNFGRVKTIKETIDGEVFTTTHQSYSIYGDLKSKYFPSGVLINYIYDSNGYLSKIVAYNGQLLYENKGMNGYGQITSYKYGNGKTSSNYYTHGMPTRYYTAGIQDYRMTWDYQSGNLEQRKDARINKTEDFTYDNLNRLKTSTVLGQAPITMTYKNNGNIDSKSDAGTKYNYDNNKINALVSIEGDINISHSTQDISYTSFFQPEDITEDNHQMTFRYGSDHQRSLSILKQNGTEVERKYYLGDYEKQVTNTGTKHINYVGQGVIVVTNTQGSIGGSSYYYYTYTDHLGSVLKVTNNSGTVVANQNFDAWGRFRNPNNWTYTNLPTNNASWLSRGYTGHEHLETFALINMNGRLYDPVVGRMLSVDNNIQAPGYTQNYNRYSYALNNPLRYTDPDGEFITWSFGKAGFSIGFNLSPIGIPIGAGINIGKGTLGIYGEVGVRVGGTGFGSGYTISQSLDYNFSNKSWSSSTSGGVYASLGILNAGVNISSLGWGASLGIGFGNDKTGLGFNIAYGSGGFSYGIGGYYNPGAWKNNPEYEPSKWNDSGEIQYSNNCYSYACNDPYGHPVGGKPQPGEASGRKFSRMTLEDITDASIRDGLKKPNLWNKLGFGKKGYYEVYLVIDKSGSVQDYHWYRRDTNGKWSHKPGHHLVKNLDASGKLISNPKRANHNYPYINYSDGGIILWKKQ